MFKELDPLLHSQLRLAIMSLLIGLESAEFTFIKEKTNSTAGNLSVQLDKLSEAGYLAIDKSFKGKKPVTTCRITKKGIKAFDDYVTVLRTIYQQIVFFIHLVYKINQFIIMKNVAVICLMLVALQQSQISAQPSEAVAKEKMKAFAHWAGHWQGEGSISNGSRPAKEIKRG